MEVQVKLILTKEEVVDILKQHFAQTHAGEIDVKITKFGDNLATVELPAKKADTVVIEEALGKINL
jgi:Holliday junction resolvase-like predicted endonuclease